MVRVYARRTMTASFGLWVGYVNIKGAGRFIDVFLPFYAVTISWGLGK